MEIDKIDFHNYLKSIGVTHLYHANTIKTSCTYIKSGGLLSRGAVEQKKLTQTAQSSDMVDKHYKVWDDIFLDSVDLHDYFHRNNHYGPVLFKLNIDVLLYENLPELWILKDNPIRWNENQNLNDRYFSSIDELKMDFENERQKKMITLKKTKEIIPFEPYLDSIILDNPFVKIEGIDLYNEGIKIITNCLRDSGIDVNIISMRQCRGKCYCISNYKNQLTMQKLKELFLL